MGAALAAIVPLAGCVAAVIPVAAAGGIGSKARHRHTVTNMPAATPLAPAAPPAQIVQSAPVAASPAPGTVPAEMQYLYGSAEAAAISRQGYAALTSFLLARKSDRDLGNRVYSVVLAPGATLAKPVYEECGTKPLAVVFDVDETVLLNAGFEADQLANGNHYDGTRWQAWERTGAAAVLPVPGAREAIATARAAKIAVIFNTNRSAVNAAGTEAAIDKAGLGPARHGETLWLKGDLGSGDGKDSRRHAISQRYCVVALVGDQLGDFSDLFNVAANTSATRRAAAIDGPVANLWGQGWFVFPNPVYGTALKGGVDDVFPARTHWAPSAPAQEKR